MLKLTILLSFFSLAACGAQSALSPNETARPMRIVSLDYCADQFVLKFVDKDRILAVSPDAGKEFSYMRDAAKGVRVARPVAEDVIILKPDLVVRSYGGGPNAAAFFERAGVPVLNVGWAGDVEAVIANIERMADELGEPQQGQAVIADMRARLAAIASTRSSRSSLCSPPASSIFRRSQAGDPFRSNDSPMISRTSLRRPFSETIPIISTPGAR